MATITGETKKWHTVTLQWNTSVVLDEVIQSSPDTVPTVDYRLLVTFTRPDSTTFVKPGYFAADGNAENSGATSGTVWRCKVTPDQIGLWSYTVKFVYSPDIFREYPININTGTGVEFNGDSGTFIVTNSDKTGVDFRAKGRLNVVSGTRYRQFADTGKYFIKVGPDAPETTLAYEDIDNTTAGRTTPTTTEKLKSWSPHLSDWNVGDPQWGQQQGRGLIGAINYLASKGMNSMSMLTWNVANDTLVGDGDQVHPYAESDKSLLDSVGSPDVNNRLRFDVSKMEQWGVIFEYMQTKGIHLHIKLQETENDHVMENGDLGDSRKAYLYQMVARYSHLLGLTWNIGEENTQTAVQERAMAKYIADLDPHNNLIVMHTYPGEKNRYNSLTGSQSELTGASLQIANIDNVNTEINTWRAASLLAGKQWVVACDETGPATDGVACDASYTGNKGSVADNRDDVRKKILWGCLMAGGEGVEYYYGYNTGETDLVAEDHRSRDTKWDDANHAKVFFETYPQDLNAMIPSNSTVSGTSNLCLKNDGTEYIVYLPNGGTANITTTGSGTYSVGWYDPKTGGGLKIGSTTVISAGGTVSIGTAPYNQITQDWAVYIQKLDNTIVYADLEYGYNATDATSFYYNAINGESGTGNTLVFRDMGNPWYITSKQILDNITDLTIRFEPGMTLEAKQGFWSPSSPQQGRFFHFRNSTNVTIEGWGATIKMYNSDFPTSEFAHNICLQQCTNFNIYGTTHDGTGGDNTNIVDCNNIYFEDCKFVNGRRLNGSLIYATNVTYRHCIFEMAGGTNPNANFDIEPNPWYGTAAQGTLGHGHRIQNILFDKCQFKDAYNENFDFGFFYMDADHVDGVFGSTPDLDVTLVDCYGTGAGQNPNIQSGRGFMMRINGTDRYGTTAGVNNTPNGNLSGATSDSCVGGTVTLTRVFMEESLRGAWNTLKQATPNYDLIVNDCAFMNAWQQGTTSGQMIYMETASYYYTNQMGGIQFNNAYFKSDNCTGTWFGFRANNFTTAFRDVTGNVTTLLPSGSSGITYLGSYNPVNNINVTVTEDFNTSMPATTVQISVLEQYAIKNIGQRATARITRSSSKVDYPLPVKYTIGSSALNPVIQGDDIHHMPGFVIIPAGETFADVEIVARNDGNTDPDRDIVVTIDPRDWYTVGANNQATLTVIDGISSPCTSDYVEENGYVVIYAEDLDITGTDWEVATSVAGYTNSGYLRWAGANFFNTPGNGTISATIRITNPGTYRFQWRSKVGQGIDSTEHNDSWLRFPDASDFYGQKTGSTVYPIGSGKTPIPNGAGADGWFKVFLSGTTNWTWATATSDNDGHPIYVDFDTPGVYTMEISGRSFDHLIDRIVLYQASVADPLNTANTETPCTEVADIIPPSVSSVAAIDITENSANIDWTLDEAGTGQVEYGLTTSYGNVSILESNFLSRHVQALTGLLPNTLYNYRVTGQDASGNVYVGSNQTFTTNAAAVPEVGILLTGSQVGDNDIVKIEVGSNDIPLN